MGRIEGAKGQREETADRGRKDWTEEERGKGVGVEKTRRARVSGPAPRRGLKGPRTRTRSQYQAHGSGSHALSITHQAGAVSPPGGRRSAGPGGAVDWGRRVRPGGLEQRPGWRLRVRQTGDPGGRRERSLNP